MPSLKEIKNRIASVNSTRKITSAMKMVASSKLHHAQVAIQNMLPYETLLEHILKSFLASDRDIDMPFDKPRPVHRVALIVFTSNSSLCGGFNNNVIRKMIEVMNEYKAQGLTDDDFLIYPVGRKVEEKVTKMGLKKAGSFLELADKPNSEGCRQLGTDVGTKWYRGEVDKVEMIYHHFKSAGSQILTRKTFLPIDLEDQLYEDKERDLSSDVVTAKAQEYKRRHGHQDEESEREEAKPLNDDFIVEPDVETVLRELVPKELHLMIYTALLDSAASEHAARMVAMQTATDNADELLRDLNLDYNKSRQAAITNELLDLAGGAQN